MTAELTAKGSRCNYPNSNDKTRAVRILKNATLDECYFLLIVYYLNVRVGSKEKAVVLIPLLC